MPTTRLEYWNTPFRRTRAVYLGIDATPPNFNEHDPTAT